MGFCTTASLKWSMTAAMTKTPPSRSYETTSLHITPGTALLVVTRLAVADKTIAVEETRVPGDAAQVAYPLPVTAQPTARATTSRRRTTPR